jgi:hypothetical protein
MKTLNDLPGLLLETGLDPVQVARLTDLPLPLIRGCHDVLEGTRDGERHLRSDDERELYVRGQRIADAWFMDEPSADET